MIRAVGIFILSVVLAYGLVQHALRPPAVGRARFNPEPDLAFAVGGMIPSSGMTNPDETRRNLHAAHCASSDRGLDVGPEELEGVVTWKRGAPVTVVCPGTEVVHRETLGGYVVRCDAERVDLYVKLGRVTPEEMVGCLAILGARDAVAADLEATQIPDGFQAAFQLRNRTYVWTEKKTDGPDDAIDNVEMLPETYPETAAARQE